MHLSDLYLISGIFFQEQIKLGMEVRPIEGTTMVPQLKLAGLLYTGILELDPHHVLGSYKGTIIDSLGPACLSNIVINDGELRFEKRYRNGQPHAWPIFYTLCHAQDLEYSGAYSIPDLDVQGYTRCFLQPITEEFLRPILVHEMQR